MIIHPRFRYRNTQNANWTHLLHKNIHSPADPTDHYPVEAKLLKGVVLHGRPAIVIFILMSDGADQWAQDEMGVGKTAQVIRASMAMDSELERMGRPRKPTLVIVPPSVSTNWENEIRLWDDRPESQACKIIKYYEEYKGSYSRAEWDKAYWIITRCTSPYMDEIGHHTDNGLKSYRPHHDSCSGQRSPTRDGLCKSRGRRIPLLPSENCCHKRAHEEAKL